MSLETAIAEQTAAIAANTTALSALLAMWTAKPATTLTASIIKDACAPLTKATRTPLDTTPVTVLTTEQQDAVRWADAEVRGVSTGTPAALAPAAETPAPVVVTKVVTPPAAIEYPQVMKAITDCVKVDRDRAVATLAKFNAKKGTELKVEDYTAFLAALGGAA